MAELVYAPVLGTGSRKGLEVQVLFWAPKSKTTHHWVVFELKSIFSCNWEHLP
jgi:hypothetical protein